MKQSKKRLRRTATLLIVFLAACGSDQVDTTTSTSPTSVISSTSSTSTTTPLTTTPSEVTTTSPATTTTVKATTTTLASGPFGSLVSTEGVTAQLAYSLATPQDICTGIGEDADFGGDEEVIPTIDFQNGPITSVGDAVVICFLGFGRFEDVTFTITPPGSDGVEAPTARPREGSSFIMWTVLPGDPLGDYSVQATPVEPEEEPVVATFAVNQATIPGLRIVEPDAERWDQPEWPGRASVEQIFLAYFGLQAQSRVMVDIYWDPNLAEITAQYVGSLAIVSEPGGAGILALPRADESGFFCFSIRSNTPLCNAAVKLVEP